MHISKNPLEWLLPNIAYAIRTTILKNLNYVQCLNLAQIHRFTANDYVMFKEIWNEFRRVKTHCDFLINHNLRKRSINNKLFNHSVKIHKDFSKLIYHSYGLWIIRKNESRRIKELLENTCLKSNRDKKNNW